MTKETREQACKASEGGKGRKRSEKREGEGTENLFYEAKGKKSRQSETESDTSGEGDQMTTSEC